MISRVDVRGIRKAVDELVKSSSPDYRLWNVFNGVFKKASSGMGIFNRNYPVDYQCWIRNCEFFFV